MLKDHPIIVQHVFDVASVRLMGLRARSRPEFLRVQERRLMFFTNNKTTNLLMPSFFQVRNKLGL
jgi:hypothetical protein